MVSGLLVIISAPSGTGKSTLCRLLLKRNRNLRYSISCTTRAPRPGEKSGVHYFFLTHEEFRSKERRGEFLETAVVHGERYGTPREFAQGAVARGQSVLLAIDVQGAASIRRQWPECVRIFVLPPSMAELRERLARRKDAEESVEKRLANAREELKSAPLYDYCVVNDRLPVAVRQIEAILTAETLKPGRQRAGSLKVPVLA